MRFGLLILIQLAILGSASVVAVAQEGEVPRANGELATANGHVFVKIPSGGFEMGDQEGTGAEFDRPVHRVKLSAFWMDRYPVTVKQFSRFVDATEYRTDAEAGEGCWIETAGAIRYDASWRDPGFAQAPDHPVLCVSWNDAMAYAAWLAELSGLHVSLPTEAQWERAARGDDRRPYPWGSAPPDGTRANFADSRYARAFPDRRRASREADDGFAQTSPVGAYPAGRSVFGVYDMAGNTIDWLRDWFDPAYYETGPAENPLGPELEPVRHKYSAPGGWASNLARSIRGGAWTDASGQESFAAGGHSIRSDRRELTQQFSSDDHMSFRLAIDPERPPATVDPTRLAVKAGEPRAMVAERVGDVTVRFDYRRARVAGREGELFGKAIPFERSWSIAAPSPALLHTDGDIFLENAPLGRGTYAIEIIPSEIVEGSSRWVVRLREWSEWGGPGGEVLRVLCRAQIEDNSKEELEVFFDHRPEQGLIARVLFGLVEVHLGFSARADAPRTGAPPPDSRAEVLNSVGRQELLVSYLREWAPDRVFGNVVPYGTLWEAGRSELEARGDVLIEDVRVPAGRYRLRIVPREEARWEARLTPLQPAVPGEGELSVRMVAPPLGEKPARRLEWYFDRDGEGHKTLVLAWGRRTARLRIESTDEPSPDS